MGQDSPPKETTYKHSQKGMDNTELYKNARVHGPKSTNVVFGNQQYGKMMPTEAQEAF